MEKRNLCGIPVSPLCMGTAAFGYAVPEQTAFRLLDVFCERGGSFVDTANVYCRWEDGTNGSERCIGRYLRLRGKGRLTVATKGGHFAVSDPATSRIRLQELRRDAEESLRTLGLDTIGFYWLHRDDPAIPADEILGMCETLRREGKNRALRRFQLDRGADGASAQSGRRKRLYGIFRAVRCFQLRGGKSRADGRSDHESG